MAGTLGVTVTLLATDFAAGFFAAGFLAAGFFAAPVADAVFFAALAERPAAGFAAVFVTGFAADFLAAGFFSEGFAALADEEVAAAVDFAGAFRAVEGAAAGFAEPSCFVVSVVDSEPLFRAIANPSVDCGT